MAAQNANSMWSDAHTQYVMDRLDQSNEEIGMALGRTPYAVQWKRAHMAAKLHAAHPELSVEECAGRTHACPVQTLEAVKSKRAKDSSFEALMHPISQPPPAPGGARLSKVPKAAGFDQPQEQRIVGVCEAIAAEDGLLTPLFSDEAMLPLLIKYYPGFHAYAMHVRGL